MIEQHPFKWRHFQADVILLCVRWYLHYTLSYRDLEELMLERGLHVDHTTPKRENDNYYQQYGSYFWFIVQAIKGDFIRSRCWY
jgi:transposase-like protein